MFSQLYFQQKTDYEIKVELNDSLKLLTGNIIIHYTNHSEDTLQFIKFHLWPNAYSGRNTALCKQMVESNNTGLFFADEHQKGWIDSLLFRDQDGALTLQPDPNHPDVADLILSKPLMPGAKVILSSPFTVKIPDSRFSRFGYYRNSYFITQWFPKPAVFDRNGWHAMPYLNQGEFYSEFGKFRVEITLPAEYRVAATGRLLNQQETAWLNDLSAGKELPNPSVTPTKTLVYEQDSIHDFAWFADKEYEVMKTQIEIGEEGRTIDGWVFHSAKGEKYWQKSLDYIEKGIKYYSAAIGAYPYSHFTVVDGHLAAGGGMEYPMITIVNSPSTDASLEHVIVHELCHNWFYGMLASNEREHAWMDEGFTTYFETKYFENYYSGDELISRSNSGTMGTVSKLMGADHLTPFDEHVLIYKLGSARNGDKPMQTPSSQFNDLEYGAVVYSKTTLALSFLSDYLGNEVFNQCIRSYFEQWKFKHPQPEDLEKSFESVSGKDLDWFFHGIVEHACKEHYSIKEVQTSNKVSLITLKSESPSKVPVKIVNQPDGESQWVDGFEGLKTIQLDFALKDGFGLNNDSHVLFKDRYSCYNAHGKSLPKDIRAKAFYQLTNTGKTVNHTVLPVVGWNRYNRWMAGVHITNMVLIPEKTEFFLTPMYDFTNKLVTGMGEISHHIYPESGLFSGITLSLSGKRFAYDHNRVHSDTLPGSRPVFLYGRIVPTVTFDLRNHQPRSRKQQSLMVRHVAVWQDEIRYTANPSGYNREFIVTEQHFSELGYRYMDSRAIDPRGFNSTIQYGKDHLKISAELQYRLSYKKKNKGLDVRLFAGGFLRNETTTRNYNFRMSGWKGRDDYLFDEIYLGRNDTRGLWPNQFLVRDGGFKIATAIGQTRDWLAALNLQTDLPVPLPLKCYFDIGTFEGITTIIEGESKVVMFNGGLAVSLIKNTLEVYVPLFYSSDIKRNLEVNNVSFAEQIRFVFNIRNLAPVKLRDDIINSF